MEHDIADFFDTSERREEVRLALGAEIYLEKVAAEPGSGELTEVLRCEALDVSANGLQVLLDSPLTVGAIHTLIVEIYRSEASFKLIAEVKWQERCNEGYHVGLVLFDSEGSAIVDWKLAIASYLN